MYNALLHFPLFKCSGFLCLFIIVVSLMFMCVILCISIVVFVNEMDFVAIVRCFIGSTSGLILSKMKLKRSSKDSKLTKIDDLDSKYFLNEHGFYESGQDWLVKKLFDSENYFDRKLCLIRKQFSASPEKYILKRRWKCVNNQFRYDSETMEIVQWRITTK